MFTEGRHKKHKHKKYNMDSSSGTSRKHGRALDREDVDENWKERDRREGKHSRARLSVTLGEKRRDYGILRKNEVLYCP